MVLVWVTKLSAITDRLIATNREADMGMHGIWIMVARWRPDDHVAILSFFDDRPTRCKKIFLNAFYGEMRLSDILKTKEYPRNKIATRDITALERIKKFALLIFKIELLKH